jgi:hypothetical protein
MAGFESAGAIQGDQHRLIRHRNHGAIGGRSPTMALNSRGPRPMAAYCAAVLPEHQLHERNQPCFGRVSASL